MGRWRWPLVLLVTFAAGWAVGGGRTISPARPDADHERQTVVRLQQEVESLHARLRAREEPAAVRASGASAARVQAPAPQDQAPAGARRVEPSTLDPGGASGAARPVAAAPASVGAALERFYKYMEATREPGGRGRWREARELVDELRAMGAPAGQALMQVLASGNDSDERRTAARLLGQLQIAQALPAFRDVIEKDTDLLLRRAAAAGLRQLQTPESIPVMERMLAQPGEDRFVRLSAAIGLANSGKPHGVAGLVQIFEESSADGRGRETAFHALTRLKDDRPLPFMRQLATSQAEPGYRLQAIRYLAAHGDQQALGALNVLMQSPTEQPSIRDAAAQAYTAINAR